MKPTILIVDDEEDICEDLSAILEGEGYFTIVYRDGQEVYESIEDGLKYDLVIIDLALPNRSGDEVISILKRKNPKIPIISWSGYDYHPAGSDWHFQKPPVTETLIRTVNSYFLSEVLVKTK